MPLHSFVDESKTPYFRLTAALVAPAQVAALRSVAASWVLSGQRRLHFNNERESRRSQILGELLEFPIEAIIYEAADKVNEKAARDRCLTRLIRDHLERDVRRLIIEKEESRMDADRTILRKETQAVALREPLTYEHLRGFEEPLLALPDALGWCWARGGHWRVRVKAMVRDVLQA